MIENKLFGNKISDPRCKLLGALIQQFPDLVKVRNGIAEDFNKEEDASKKQDYAGQLFFIEMYLNNLCVTILVEKEFLISIDTPLMNQVIKEIELVREAAAASQKDFQQRFEDALKSQEIK